MDEVLKSKVAGKKIRAIEYTEPDCYGYSSDSIIFHLEGGGELRIYIVVNSDKPVLSIDMADGAFPLSAVYPRLDRIEKDDQIDDISVHYDESGDIYAVILSLSPGLIRLSVSEDDLYSIRIS